VTEAVGWPKSAASAGRRQRRMAMPARSFGGKLKAAGGRHGEPRDFCYDGAKAAVPHALLETDEDRLLIARLDIDHAIGHEPGLREGRGEQVLPGETPGRCHVVESLMRVRRVSQLKSRRNGDFTPRLHG
jgi:hypothetical protein